MNYRGGCHRKVSQSRVKSLNPIQAHYQAVLRPDLRAAYLRCSREIGKRKNVPWEKIPPGLACAHAETNEKRPPAHSRRKIRRRQHCKSVAILENRKLHSGANAQTGCPQGLLPAQQRQGRAGKNGLRFSRGSLCSRQRDFAAKKRKSRKPATWMNCI